MNNDLKVAYPHSGSSSTRFWKCWGLKRGENQSTCRKSSRSKGDNQQQTQPTYGIDAGI